MEHVIKYVISFDGILDKSHVKYKFDPARIILTQKGLDFLGFKRNNKYYYIDIQMDQYFNELEFEVGRITKIPVPRYKTTIEISCLK